MKWNPSPHWAQRHFCAFCSVNVVILSCFKQKFHKWLYLVNMVIVADLAGTVNALRGGVTI